MTLVQELINQRDKRMAGNLYYWSQILFSYHNNRIEGSGISSDQTQQIFDSGTLFADGTNDLIKVDDVIETQNHFRAFDFLLDTVDEALTLAYVVKLH